MNGILNIKKEKGFTSHDVVAKLRGILKQKKIGHTGTLDPDATGVLPVCLGSATVLCDLLTDKIKEYKAEIQFGIATDTEDISGTVIKTMPVSFTKNELSETVRKFIGDIDQIPPMYSAIKIDGKKLYQLAREGVTVARKARQVKIYSIDIDNIKTDDNGIVTEACITVVCGKGTYIRSLCRDMGEALGTAACMKSLVRTKSGRFDIENALTLDEIIALQEKDELKARLFTVEEFFSDLPSFKVKTGINRLILNGNKLKKEEVETDAPFVNGQNFRAYDEAGRFVAVYTYLNNEFKPFKMFLAEETHGDI